ncbi:MAG: hypothetical protein HOV87_12660 [Catenulispora sp.]|nr:hypothetical protein [Catenulispora sp.]
MTSGIRGRLAAAAVAAAAVGGMLAVVQPAAQAAPSYQNSFIAFGGSTAGWSVVDVDGSNRHTVTPVGGGYDPATQIVITVKYSFDGTRVAFLATHGTAGELWVAAADGTGARKLADAAGQTYHTSVAWSPDGKLVYYAFSGQIYQIPADGTGSPVVAFTDTGGCNDSAPQTTQSGYLFFSRICGSSGPTTQYGGMAVHRPGDLLPVPVTATVGAELSAISPDGTRVADSRQDPTAGTTTREMLLANAVNDNDIMHHTVVLPVGTNVRALTFGASGDILYSDASFAAQPGGPGTWTSTIHTVPDGVNQTPHTVLTLVGAANSQAPVDYLDWVHGTADFGIRPVADRVGGGDRIATSIDASKWTYDDKNSSGRKASSAVLARSDTFADALGGTALAIQNNGPLLLTPTAGLDKGVENELTRILQPRSIVYVLGGTAALSPAVENRLTALGFSVRRVYGENRYATSVAIATEIGGTPHQTSTVMVATGADYPDALAAGVAAGQERYTGFGTYGLNGGVVVLTDGATMPKDTADYLKQIDPHRQHVYAVGGQAVKAVQKAFPTWTGVTPLAGANRFETAAKVAASPLFGNGAPGRYPMVGVATAANWPDALSGGALIGNQGGPLLLADGSGTPGSQGAIVSGSHLKGLVVFGGTAVVPDSALAAIADNAFGTGAWDARVDRSAPALP